MTSKRFVSFESLGAFVVRRLTISGYSIDVATNGLEALDALAKASTASC